MAKRTAPKPQQFGPRYNRQPKAKIQRHASTHTTYTGKPKTGYLTLRGSGSCQPPASSSRSRTATLPVHRVWSVAHRQGHEDGIMTHRRGLPRAVPSVDYILAPARLLTCLGDGLNVANIRPTAPAENIDAGESLP